MDDDRIILFVGNESFVTTIATLTGESGYFQGRLSGRWDIPKNGRGMLTCFVDADPDTFVHVLRYLRTGRMPLFWTKAEGFDLGLYAQMLGQAHFLVIPKIIQWIEEKRFELAVYVSVHPHFESANNWRNGEYIYLGGEKFSDVTVIPHWFTNNINDSDATLGYRESRHCEFMIITKQTHFDHEHLVPRAKED